MSTKKESTEPEQKKPAVKTWTELEGLRSLSAKTISAGSPTVACWFKDNGGKDQCIPMERDACINEGGVPTAGPCPNVKI